MTLIRMITLGLFLATAATAQTGISFTTVVSDPNAPVDVKADQLDVDQETGKAIFTGNVRATQEKLFLSAARIEVDYDEEAKVVRSMVASGGVVFVSPNEEAESQNAIYFPEEGKLEMWGEVLVLQGTTAISGNRLKVNLNDGQAEMIGQVRTVFGAD